MTVTRTATRTKTAAETGTGNAAGIGSRVGRPCLLRQCQCQRLVARLFKGGFLDAKDIGSWNVVAQTRAVTFDAASANWFAFVTFYPTLLTCRATRADFMREGSSLFRGHGCAWVIGWRRRHMDGMVLLHSLVRIQDSDGVLEKSIEAGLFSIIRRHHDVVGEMLRCHVVRLRPPTMVHDEPFVPPHHSRKKSELGFDDEKQMGPVTLIPSTI